MVRMVVRGRGGNNDKPPSVVGRLGLSLFFLFFFAIGSLFEVLILHEFVLSVGQRSWKKVPCRVVSSEVQESGDGEKPYAFAVRYEYDYGGRRHSGSKYKRDYRGSGSYSKTQQLVQRYPAGSSASCYVNPGNPNEAVLRRQSLLIGLVAFFPLIFVLIGAGGIYGTWRKAPLRKEKPVAPIASTGRKGWGKFGLAAFFSIFAIAGGAMLYPLGIKPIAKTIDARSWAETPCKVLRAEVRSHDSDDGTTYSVYILYEYEFDGQMQKADDYDFVGGSSSGHKSKARIVEQYKSAANPVCYVNPRDSTEAVLKRGFHAKLLLALLPLPFLAVGVGGVFGVLRHRRRFDPVTGLPRAGRARRATGSDMSLLRLPDSGPVTLRPRHSSGGKLAGVILIAGFWNGCISIPLHEIVDGFRHGSPPWFLTLFMTPFVLIGIVLLGLVVYQFLAMFNPRPTLTLSAESIPLGGTAELSWSFSGRTGRIREFTVTLRGVEEARYRRGTNTRTDRSTFYELELYRTSDTTDIGSGHVGVIVPTDTMHSFEAENNKILWALDIRGDIQHWPDVKESFPLHVLPA